MNIPSALGVAFLVLITYIGVRRLAATTEAAPTKPSPPAKPPQATPATSGETVESLMQDGQKIQAIKLYREQTGVGLAEAKDAVEAMMRGEPNPTLSRATTPSRAFAPDVVSLVRSGQKIQAIKLYREQTGVGLAEAKNAVEAMMDGTFIQPPLDTPRNADGLALADLIRSGRKIEAIKLYRDQTGLGLKEAKDYVEALAQQL